MRRYLVVAHRTLVGQHLMEHVKGCVSAGPCRFHLVVPVQHPSDHAWTEGEVEADARRRLEEGLAAFRNLGAEADGEVGDVNPVYACSAALRALRARSDDVDEIIVSTLPVGVSRWLKVDVVSRIEREVDVPVTHLLAEPAAAR